MADIMQYANRLQEALVKKAAVVDTALLTSLEAWEHVYSVKLMKRIDNRAKLAVDVENLRACYADLYGFNGNLKEEFWQHTEEGLLLGFACKLLYGAEWIDHTDAVALLAGVISDPSEWQEDKTRTYPRLRTDLVWFHERVLYPSKRTPGHNALTAPEASVIAYYDPDERGYRHGARVRRSEVLSPTVRALWEGRGKRKK